MTTIKIYRNKRNKNKYIEVHNDGYYHNSVRQYIKNIRIKRHKPLYELKNYTGDGCLHRWHKANLNELLEDYSEV